MKWDWNFLAGKKTALPLMPLADRHIHINGAVHEIQGAHLGDMEVAGRVRMLMRTDLNHESVCTLARDRIVYLSDRLDEVTSVTEEQIARSIYGAASRNMSADFPAGWTARRFEELNAEERALLDSYGAAVLTLITGPLPAPEIDAVEAAEVTLRAAGMPT